MPPVVPTLPISALTLAAFERDHRATNMPLLVHGVDFGELTKLDARGFGALLDDRSIDVRAYSKGFLDNPDAWIEKGYCPKLARMRGWEYATMIESGMARAEDLYAVCDVRGSRAGAIFEKVLAEISQRTGLKSTPHLPGVSIWWGPPGHREPLHMDITDGTLFQIHGEKTVTLFPDHAWKYLYPFELGSAMSWSFSKVHLPNPDFERYPLLENALRERIDVTLRPGDMLFIPTTWAHEVTGSSEGDHVLSMNHFWHTPMTKLVHIQEAALQKLVPEPTRSELVAKRQAMKAP